MNDKINTLLKTDTPSKTTQPNDALQFSKNRIKRICKAFCLDANQYRPEKSVSDLKDYLNNKNKLDRILYSEISNYIFNLSENKRGTFATNIDSLLQYSRSEQNNVPDDCCKIIIKIYDHFHLALHQIENAENILRNATEDIKESIKKDSKGLEREYITILGIFAAIILAFVGGITFSTSVLQNIANASIYRLLTVIVLLALAMTNAIYVLIKFICLINDKHFKSFKIRWFNIICMVMLLLILVAWLIDADKLSEFIRDFLPWIKNMQ